MGNQMITVPMSRYDELVEKESRINVLCEMLQYDKSMLTNDIFMILGKKEYMDNGPIEKA